MAAAKKLLGLPGLRGLVLLRGLLLLLRFKIEVVSRGEVVVGDSGGGIGDVDIAAASIGLGLLAGVGFWFC